MSIVEESALQYKMREVESDTETPISIFKKVSGTKKCLLESSLKHEEEGRYSFVMANPFMQIKAVNHITTIEKLNKETKIIEEDDPLETMRKFCQYELEGPLPFPFMGGGVGYVGFDFIRYFEKVGEPSVDQENIPDLYFQFYENIIVFDHFLQKIYLVVSSRDGSRHSEELDRALDELEDVFKQTPEKDEKIEHQSLTFTSNIKKEDFIKNVLQAKEEIRKGNVYQLVLSQRFQADCPYPPFEIYRSLRRANPSPYMFYIEMEDEVLIGSSPERLVQIQNKVVVTNPIAGTRAIPKNSAEFEGVRKDLQEDEKERAEHLMLVDLGRNDVGKVSEVGSVYLSKFLEIERFQHVMHLVSEVKGTLRDDLDSFDALRSCLPAGTVSGAPKLKAVQLLYQMESTKRGVYGGGIGYLNWNGDMDLALAIRTMQIRDGIAYVQAGAGVVYDSDPMKEYEETLQKAKSLLEVLA
jgi:anthranilate synthase component 1